MADQREQYTNPKYYQNRELSWLQFDRRCLSEARNKDNTFLMRSTVEAEYATAHKDYGELKEKIEGTRSELYDINEELSMRESFRSELAACAGRVKDAGLATEEDEAA